MAKTIKFKDDVSIEAGSIKAGSFIGASIEATVRLYSQGDLGANGDILANGNITTSTGEISGKNITAQAYDGTGGIVRAERIQGSITCKNTTSEGYNTDSTIDFAVLTKIGYDALANDGKIENNMLYLIT